MKVLFTPYGGGSIAHMVRSFAVADELKRRGHQILFTAPKSKKDFVNKAGYDVYGEGHATVNMNDEKLQGIAYFRAHRQEFLDWLSDEIKAAESFRPDIIVNSPSFFGPTASARLGIPHVSLVNAFWLPEFKGILGLGRSKDAISHKALRKIANPILKNRFEAVYMKEVQDYYRSLGIEKIPRKRTDLHSAAPAIIPGIPDFEPIDSKGRTDLHYIGPLFWEGFEKEEFDPENLFPDFKEKPFVYVTLGGSIFRKQTYEELIAAFAGRTGWNVLLSLGPNIGREHFPKDCSNLAIRPFVPGLKVCAHADVIVNTGGHGTVMQALWNGKPLVAIPHNLDQGTIAERIEELGVGINLNKLGLRDFSHTERFFKKATQIAPEKIVRAVEKVLGDPGMRKRAKDFGALLKTYGSAEKVAADIIETYAGAS